MFACSIETIVDVEEKDDDALFQQQKLRARDLDNCLSSAIKSLSHQASLLSFADFNSVDSIFDSCAFFYFSFFFKASFACFNSNHKRTPSDYLKLAILLRFQLRVRCADWKEGWISLEHIKIRMDQLDGELKEIQGLL